jgi:hypothetical protein
MPVQIDERCRRAVLRGQSYCGSIAHCLAP